MAFRIEAAALACLMALPGAAQEYRVKQGLLTVTSEAIRFERNGRVRQWKLGDIRQLTLGTAEVRVQTYEGRNHEYVFTESPPELAAKWYPVFSRTLDERFVAALADEAVTPEWQIPVKLVRLRGGPQGELRVGAEHVVFRAGPEGESRTWRITDIESVASAGRFDLTVTTREREFHFDLKQALPEAHYDELWRRVNRAQGLRISQ